MNRNYWKRTTIVTAFSLIAIGGGLFMATNPSPTLPITARYVPVPLHPQGGEVTRSLPFTFEQVVKTLTETFRLQLLEKRDGKHAVLNLLDQTVAGTSRELMRVVVTAKGDHLLVTFSLRESIGMHYLSEFLESRLFTPWEAEHLYQVMERRRDAEVPADLGRFVVTVTHGGNETWQFIAFDFAPARIS